MLDLYFLLFVLAVGDHGSYFLCPCIHQTESSVWRVIDMPALFLHIVILSFSLLSLLQTQIHLITRVIGTNIKSVPPPFKLDIFQMLKVDNRSVRSTTAVNIS